MTLLNIAPNVVTKRLPGTLTESGTTLVLVLAVFTAATCGTGKKNLKDFNVVDYGARADGVHDNSPAIQAAITAAVEAGGGRIVLPPAEQPYLITDSIRLTASHLHLVADGATVFLKDGAATGRTAAEEMVHIIRIQGTADSPIEEVSVRGINIDANYWGQTNNTASWQQSAKLAGITRGIKVNHARHVRIEDVIIDRSFVGMTFGLGSHHSEARNVKVTRFHHDGFGVTPEYTDAGATHIVYRDCVASDAPNGGRGGLPGQRIKGWEIEEGAQHVKVIDCVVRDTDANGFYVRPHAKTGEYSTRHVELIRCRVENAGDAAFAVKSSTHGQPVSDVRIVDCVAVDGALAVRMNPDRVSIEGGHFGHMEVGYFKDYDVHINHLVGPSKEYFDHLPVRSFQIDGAAIEGDVRINANEGYDGKEHYTPQIRLSNLTIAGDVYIVGTESYVQMNACTVAGTQHVLSTEEYFQPLLDAYSTPIELSRGKVSRCAVAPKIDGNDQDPCWSDAERMEIVYDWEKLTGRAEDLTFVQLCYGQKALYVLFNCLEDKIEKLRTVATTHDADLWEDDGVEIFFHRDHDAPDYFRQWMISAAGVVYDGDKTSAERWAGTARISTQKFKDRYVVEVAIPWQDLGGPLRSGEQIRANFARNRATNETHWVWSWQYDLNPAFGDPNKMGLLSFE